MPRVQTKTLLALHPIAPSPHPPADINSEHRRRSVVIVWDFLPAASAARTLQQLPLQCDHMPSEVHYVILWRG